MIRGATALIGAVAGALVLSSCSSASTAPADGDYRSFAAASSISALPVAEVIVSGTNVRMTVGDMVIDTTLVEGDDSFVVCPPEGLGTTWLAGDAVTVDGAVFEKPAFIADCGTTKPVRITLVDLASVSEESTPFPFGRWIEFCDVTDPDCPVVPVS